MIRTVGDFQANYKAIILSEKLSECRKNTLLRNLLNDIENIFFGTCKKEKSIIEQQKEAKSLYKQIKKIFHLNLTSNLTYQQLLSNSHFS